MTSWHIANTLKNSLILSFLVPVVATSTSYLGHQKVTWGTARFRAFSSASRTSLGIFLPCSFHDDLPSNSNIDDDDNDDDDNDSNDDDDDDTYLSNTSTIGVTPDRELPE